MNQQLTLEGKPIEYRPYRHITLNEQKEFCEFLQNLGIFEDKLKDLLWCSSEYCKYDCVSDFNPHKESKVSSVWITWPMP